MKDFMGSDYLLDQWMMFGKRHPLCLDEDNDVILEGGMASTHTNLLLAK